MVEHHAGAYHKVGDGFRMQSQAIRICTRLITVQDVPGILITSHRGHPHGSERVGRPILSLLFTSLGHSPNHTGWLSFTLGLFYDKCWAVVASRPQSTWKASKYQWSTSQSLSRRSRRINGAPPLRKLCLRSRTADLCTCPIMVSLKV
jgi:hypothetical protein